MNMPVQGSNEAPTCHGGLENLDEEHDYLIDEVEGEVPADLCGTFLRNGPGRQRIGGVPYGHWFDGDGMLSVFSIADGKARFKNSYVKTPKYLKETAAQRVCYRGFGTQIPGGWWHNAFKLPPSPANTSVIYHGGHLLALNEGGLPWEVEPGNLETKGEFNYDGGLFGRAFSAHGKIHPDTGDYINFGSGSIRRGLRAPQPCLNLFRIDRSGKVVASNQAVLDRFPFCHDFALSDHYGIFFIGSIVFGNMGRFFMGLNSIAELIGFDDNLPMKVVVVDLKTLAVVRQFETEPGAIIHFGNAFEEGDEIVIDGMYAGEFEANETLSDVFNPEAKFGGGTYNRYRLNMKTGALSSERVTHTESEFPTFNPRFAGKRQTYTYTACAVANGADSFFNGFQKIDFDGNANLVTLPPGYYGSEPIFAPRQGASGEDDGYLLEVVYDGFAHKSELHIVRAEDPSELVGKLHLRHHLPHQFHGLFVPEILLR